MQADFDAYFNATTGWAAVGSKYSDPSFGGASFTKLDNNTAQFTGADGVVNYLRAGDSLLDVAKRIPELRKIWEKAYNIRLPAFAVGTNYVPRDMTARIHEGEAIVPKAFNPWANGGSTGGDNAALIAELRTVTAQLVKVEARLAEIEKTNDQMAQQQDNGTDGGNACRPSRSARSTRTSTRLSTGSRRRAPSSMRRSTPPTGSRPAPRCANPAAISAPPTSAMARCGSSSSCPRRSAGTSSN